MNKQDTGKIAKIRSAGFFTKGIVYVLLGSLTFMAAFDLGGDISSTNNVIKFLLELPLGKALVGVIALGLFAYSIWRFYQTIKFPEGNGDDEKVKSGFKRVRYFYSGVFYGLIAYAFAKPLINALTPGNEKDVETGGGDEKAALWELLSHDWGKALIWALAILVAGQALQQFFIAYKGKFMKKIDNYPTVKIEYDFIRRAGRLGYISRGMVFGVLAFFLINVILTHNANEYKGTEGALAYFLSFSYGPVLLGAVALGLTAYGVFHIMVARHANLTRLS
ncbi:MAG TPA: DUF1206 domain-containing protein [Gillisia sp.]|nr:DUF1206 domain-containing protein [Gillisia sp.]